MSFLARARVTDVDHDAARVGIELRAWPALGPRGQEALEARRTDIEHALRALCGAWVPSAGAVLDLGFAAIAEGDGEPGTWRFFQELHLPVAAQPGTAVAPAEPRGVRRALTLAWEAATLRWSRSAALDIEAGEWEAQPFTPAMDAAVDRLRRALVRIATADTASDADAHLEFQRLHRQLVG